MTGFWDEFNRKHNPGVLYLKDAPPEIKKKKIKPPHERGKPNPIRKVSGKVDRYRKRFRVGGRKRF